MAWKLRGNLPHAVESTALLVDAQLHHHQHHHHHSSSSSPTTTTADGAEPAPSNSIFSVRAVYSAAFCRFVTGFCDMGRARERTLEPSSMLEMARQLGLPGEFVALRHEATHEELPGVGRLVEAVARALEWLWRVYWARLEEAAESGEARAAGAERVRGEAGRVLREFRGARRAMLREMGGTRRKEVAREVQLEEQLRATALGCRELVARSRVRVDALAEVLVQDKLLIPSKRG
nr:pre-rrna-processing protein las1 [Quercus suber]